MSHSDENKDFALQQKSIAPLFTSKWSSSGEVCLDQITLSFNVHNIDSKHYSSGNCMFVNPKIPDDILMF